MPVRALTGRGIAHRMRLWQSGAHRRQ